MSSVSIENVVKSYGGHPVLHGVSVDIPDGSFDVLVGPSGCGKSTLLRMIAGLEDISGGTIRIGGQAVNDLPPKERDISMVFQNYALYPHMTVAQNMAFSLTLAGASKADKAAQGTRAAEILGLTPLLDRYPHNCPAANVSGSRWGGPSCVIPRCSCSTSRCRTLTPSCASMRAEIKALLQRLKTTTVYVTDDQVAAMTMADQIVVMNAGRVEQIGSPLDLYDAPANVFVATFMGSPSMNMLAGRVVRDGTQQVVETCGARLDLPHGSMASDGQEVLFGGRPEHLVIADQGIDCAVHVVEPTGSETHVLFRAGDTDITAAFR